jgi:D-serine deaminase-like pyridoxal phosphate-dependent protein
LLGALPFLSGWTLFVSLVPDHSEPQILYAFPIHGVIGKGTALGDLAAVSAGLGPDGLSVLVDHPLQIGCVRALGAEAGQKPLVFLKVDMGYHRAGVLPDSALCHEAIDGLLQAQREGALVFHGLYCHAGHSYETRADWKALGLLHDEFASLGAVAAEVRRRSPDPDPDPDPDHPLVLSVGATPTVSALQHPALHEAAPRLVRLMADLRAQGHGLEVHAGVYPTLDLQQLATHARDSSHMVAGDMGLSILADVVSLYPGRGSNGTTEALVNAGVLALAREPVKDKGEAPGKDYGSWGLVVPWGGLEDNPVPPPSFPAEHGGWQVVRHSQEHGILGWLGPAEEEVRLEVGQRIRIWPNHACIAGAGHAYYLVVDSRRQGEEDEIIDVWPRWRGW